MAATDPAGSRASTRRSPAHGAAAARRDAVAMRVTADWDRAALSGKRQPGRVRDDRVPPAGHVARRSRSTRTRPAPTARHHPPQAQRSVAELAPVFFATGFTCQDACDPSGYNGIALHRSVDVAKFAAALTVRDITAPARERAVARPADRRRPRRSTTPTRRTSKTPATIASRRRGRTRIASIPRCQRSTARRSDYPWVGIVDNWHERAFTSFGDGHGVWESGGGPLLPFYSRNFRDVTQWLTRAPARRSGAAHRRARERRLQGLAAGRGHGPTTDGDTGRHAVVRHRPQLGAHVGNGSRVGGRAGPASPSRSRIARVKPDERGPSPRSCRSRTSGSRVKDSPQSTLVFVTRLDNGEPVGGRRGDRSSTSPTSSCGAARRAERRRRDGARHAAPQARQLGRPLVHRHGRKGRRRGVRRVELERRDHAVGFRARLPALGSRRTSCAARSSRDRGVYKPGEEVHFKAIVRADTPTGIRLLPAGSTLDIHVTRQPQPRGRSSHGRR